MADPVFRAEQRASIWAPHVAPVNRLVDDLRSQGGGWVPYVAPLHGGIEARVLSVLRDPGPKTQEQRGSGFLCIENDDPTAAAQAHAFAHVGVSPHDITPWNAYPWYINRAPKAAELQAGITPLVALVTLMPDLRVVLLQSAHGKAVWRRLRRAHPTLEASRQLTVLVAYHPGVQALWHPDPLVRDARAQSRRDAYARVALLLRTTWPLAVAWRRLARRRAWRRGWHGDSGTARA
jgi:hypothetical protein